MHRLATASLLIVSCLSMGAGEAPRAEVTRGLMRSIFVPLSEVLPISFDPKGFTDAKNAAYVAERLKALAANAEALERHAASQDRGFEFVARSLGRDARAAAERFARGRHDEARFTIQLMTENCISCHASFGSKTKPLPEADRFLASLDVKQLPPLERARLFIVSRRFDDAIASLEELLTQRDLHPMMTVSMGAMVDYMRLCLTVKKDTKRPAALIDKMLARSDTPLHVRQQLERWKMTLVELDSTGVLSKGALADARKLIDEADKVMEYPRDRDGMVHYVAAAGILGDYVHTRPDRGRDVAEAYYLLGVTDSLLEHSFWVARHEFNLESAIRLAPDAPFAAKAYGMLEEAILVGFTGSSGQHVPDDAKALLRELRTLVEQSKPAPRKS